MVPIDLGPAGRFWLKWVEVLSPRMRLQKGDPRRALQAERRAFLLLAGIGMPVASLVASGEDYLVLSDHGRTLQQMVKGHADPSDQRAAFAAAGRSLAILHRTGFAHGRPALRDICWDGREARLIDLENFDPRRRKAWRRAVDIVFLAQSWFTMNPGDDRLLDIALAAYRDHATEGDWAALCRLSARLTWLAGPSRVLARLRPSSRDTQAAARAFAYLRQKTAL